jgi:hypothetical protein
MKVLWGIGPEIFLRILNNPIPWKHRIVSNHHPLI